MSMKRSVRDAWVADLRANAELQGYNGLCINGKYCCLGRLAHIQSVQHASIEGYSYETFSFVMPDGEILTDRTTLPERWQTLIGLSGEDDDESLVGALIGMNDGGDTFPTIADWIEVNVPVVED